MDVSRLLADMIVDRDNSDMVCDVQTERWRKSDECSDLDKLRRVFSEPDRPESDLVDTPCWRIDIQRLC